METVARGDRFGLIYVKTTSWKALRSTVVRREVVIVCAAFRRADEQRVASISLISKKQNTGEGALRCLETLQLNFPCTWPLESECAQNDGADEGEHSEHSQHIELQGKVHVTSP
jgi:hypothetical protein